MFFCTYFAVSVCCYFSAIARQKLMKISHQGCQLRPPTRQPLKLNIAWFIYTKLSIYIWYTCQLKASIALDIIYIVHCIYNFILNLHHFLDFIIYHDPERRPKVTALEIMIGEHQIKPIKPNAVITLYRA